MWNYRNFVCVIRFLLLFKNNIFVYKINCFLTLSILNPDISGLEASVYVDR